MPSSYPWQSSSVFAYAFPCCDCGVCYMIVGNSADATAAQTYLDDNAKECVVDFGPLLSGTRTISATITGQLIAVTGLYTDYMSYVGEAAFRFYADGAGTLETTFSASGDGTLSNNSSLTVYDETAAANCSETGGDFTLPQAGYYTVAINIDGASGPPADTNNTGTFAFNITACDVGLTYCILQSYWDDGMDTGTVTCA